MELKYYILFFCKFIFLVNLNAQINPSIEILNKETNFYYEFVPYSVKINIDNTIKYSLIGDENVKISKNELNEFEIVFIGAAYISKISIVDSNKNEIASKKLKYYKLPVTPFLNNSTLSGMNIQKSKLLGSKLKVGIIDYNIDRLFEVKSFDLYFIDKGKLKKLSIEGNIINNDVFNKLQNLEKGIPLIFDNIKIIEYGTLRKISPLVLYIE